MHPEPDPPIIDPVPSRSESTPHGTRPDAATSSDSPSQDSLGVDSLGVDSLSVDSLSVDSLRADAEPARSLEVVPLASGSQGNAVAVRYGERALLIDAGLECEELEGRLRSIDLAPGRVDALLLTHRHRDHIRGVADFVRRHKSRVIATRRTIRSLPNDLHRRYQVIQPHSPRKVGGVTVHAFPLQHDAPDTVGFRLHYGRDRYGHATDLGRLDTPVVDGLTRCNTLYLEFNHDLELLWNGPYEAHLKRRIAGDWGHLDNGAAAELLGRVAWPGLARVWLAHLSRANNRPDLALAAAHDALGGGPAATADVRIAEQDRASTVPVREIGAGDDPGRVSSPRN